MTDKLDEKRLSEVRKEFGYKKGETMNVILGGFRWIIEPDGTLRCCLPGPR